MLLKILSFFLPWPLRRIFLQRFFGYQLHSTAKIGLAWVFPAKLIMEAGCVIDHFNVAIHLDKIEMKENSFIGRQNWITGLSTKSTSQYFKHKTNRRAELLLGESAAITKNHHFDCTDLISIGKFTTIAGYNSQLLTHSINVYDNIQDCYPILMDIPAMLTPVPGDTDPLNKFGLKNPRD